MQDMRRERASSPRTGSVDGIAHEHAFYAHRDPRWLVCDCGQLATRTRTAHGQYDIRLIDEPLGVLDARSRSESPRCRSV